MWLEAEDDLHEMYQIHDKKVRSEILLWCYMKVESEVDRPVQSRKRPLSPTNCDSVHNKTTLLVNFLEFTG